MNFSRLAVAAFAAWVAFVIIGYVVHGVLLTDLYARQASALRPGGDVHSMYGFGAGLVGFFVFAYAYAKGYEGGQGTQEGMRFGVLVALMLICFGAVRAYVVFPISGGLAAVLAVDYVVEFVVYGMIVGAIYKPVERSRRRGAR